MNFESEITAQIVELSRRLNEKNCLAAADGNLSYRISDDRILITPSGINKAFLKPKDMAVVTLSNQVIIGSPSSERDMHLEIYRNCPQANAVIHAHPPTAIAWSIAQPNLKELPSESMSELILAAGRIPIVPYARPGTDQMGLNLKPYLPECRVMILARHGAVSWGHDLVEAYNGIERLEHSAQILKSAMELGGLNPLPREEIAALHEIRRSLGETTR